MAVPKLGVDLDGVCCDFSTAYAKVLTKETGIVFPEVSETWPDVWFWEREAGVTPEQEKLVWDTHILQVGSKFWESLCPIPATYEVFLGGQRLQLTSAEFRLLHLLVESWGAVVPHQDLERALSGEAPGSSELLKTYIGRLQRKLGDDPEKPQWITGIQGVGYRLVGPGYGLSGSNRPESGS